MSKLRFYLFNGKKYRISGCSPVPDHLVAVRHATDRAEAISPVFGCRSSHSPIRGGGWGLKAY